MKDQLISFETAKLAKEKGFVSALSKKYTKHGELIDHIPLSDDGYGKHCYAPTQSLLQKWLREKHKIIVEAQFDVENYYPFIGYHRRNPRQITGKKWSEVEFKTYEQALERGLIVALTENKTPQ